MDCPFCLHKKTEIYNSRRTRNGTTVWRRRRCLACYKAFTTQEHFDLSSVWRVKTAKKTVSYSRAKLAMSILRACDHRLNQDDAAWYLYQTVENQLALQAAHQVITTQHIIKTVSQVLRSFDAAAYVKYISYHHTTALDAKTLRARLRRKH